MKIMTVHRALLQNRDKLDTIQQIIKDLQDGNRQTHPRLAGMVSYLENLD